MVRTTKALLLVLVILSVSAMAQAITRGQFVGPYGIIRVLAQDAMGSSDTDGQLLFEAMDVPVKNSMIGPGKSIETEDKGMQFICAHRLNVGYECSIFVHNRAGGAVNPVTRMMSYKVTGEKANTYGKLFKVNSQQEYNFVSIENNFKVQVKPNYFEVQYSENGVSLGDLTKTEISPKTLVVVNVEDTLKISHVRNFWDSLNYVNSTRKRFMGTSDAFSLLARHNPDFKFVYLTQSPQLVMGKNEREFLNKNDFPKGSHATYDSNQDAALRLKVVSDVIDIHKPQRVILVSHNGSPDTEVFHKLTAQFKEIVFIPYIHIVYSTLSISEVGNVLFPEQTGYVTTVELLLDWQQRGLIDVAGAVPLMRALKDRILVENVEASGIYEYGIPSFVNCDDFQWRWTVDGVYQFLAPLREHLINRCHMQAPLASHK